MKKNLLYIFFLFSVKAFALSSSDISIRIISGNIFHSDHNQCINNIGPRAVYIGLEICNISSTSLDNLQATLTGFSTAGFSLAGGQLPTQNITNPLLQGQCDTLYWFCTYPCDDLQTKIIFNISDTDDGTLVSDSSDVMTSSRELSANAGGFITASQLTSNDTINYQTCFTVVYGLSRLVNGDNVFLQPGANLDFKADCFQLERATVLSSEDNRSGCIPLGNCPLYYDITRTCGFSPTWTVIVEYCFRIQCQQTSSYLIPYASATSGNDLKYTIANSSFILPVELLYFTAKAEEKSVNIKWSTASEKNTLFFEVQKSFDGFSFFTINTVAAAGYSSVILNYSVNDDLPQQINYYRLKINDADGSSEYSSISKVVMPEININTIEVFPNPALNSIKVQFSKSNLAEKSEFKFEMYDLTGKKVYDIIHEISDNYLDLPELSSGIYLLKITYQDKIQISKLQLNNN